MKLLITRNTAGDDWAVWAGLDDEDPLDSPFGFIIGTGETKEAALQDAEVALGVARYVVHSDLIEETHCIEERELVEG